MKLFTCLALLFTSCLAAGQGEPDLTPAQYQIAEAVKLTSDKPKEYTSYNRLAAALVRRAQETSDPAYYTQAQAAVERSLSLSPDNFETGKIQVSILLGQHEYPKALAMAQALNKRVPDDVMTYGLLTDAYAELGDYKNAEVSCQWMLNLRPGNLPALLHAAYLRELFGELDGSYELLTMAFESTPATEKPDRASILTRMSYVRLLAGKTEEAEKLVREALKVFPGYTPALGVLAQVCSAQQHYGEALASLHQQYGSVPRTATLYSLARTLDLAGKTDEAKKAYSEFVAKASAESAQKDNANRELVFYYADHAHDPAKALELARQEYGWRKDVYTLDAYAWALHQNGQNAEARKQLNIALAVGVQDPQLTQHSRDIDHAETPAVAATPIR